MGHLPESTDPESFDFVELERVVNSSIEKMDYPRLASLKKLVDSLSKKTNDPRLARLKELIRRQWVSDFPLCTSLGSEKFPIPYDNSVLEPKETQWESDHVASIGLQPTTLLLPMADDNDCVPMEIVGDGVGRNNVFHATCFIMAVPVPLIIDSDSCVNIIAESLCKDRDLELLDHPHSYTLSGINGEGTVVSKLAVVPFSVGTYSDIVVFDVVQTPAVKLLLGRPWLYDMDVVHHARENSYEFVKNGKIIKLLPDY